MVECPMCNGEGGEYNAVLWNGIGGGEYLSCDFCLGDGEITKDKMNEWNESLEEEKRIMAGDGSAG